MTLLSVNIGRKRIPASTDGDAWLPWLHSEMLIYNTCDVLLSKKEFFTFLNRACIKYVCNLENVLVFKGVTLFSGVTEVTARSPRSHRVTAHRVREKQLLQLF